MYIIGTAAGPAIIGTAMGPAIIAVCLNRFIGSARSRNKFSGQCRAKRRLRMVSGNDPSQKLHISTCATSLKVKVTLQHGVEFVGQVLEHVSDIAENVSCFVYLRRRLSARKQSTVYGTRKRTWGNNKINANMKVSEQCIIATSQGNQILGMIRKNIIILNKRD